MALKQQRWLCGTCRREWVYAHAWQPDHGCPGCHSSAIEQVEYVPAFAGGDIPRENAQMLRAVADLRAVAAEMPLTLREGMVS